MRIEHKTPDHSCDLSFAPIDVGFDVRLHDITCALPQSASRVGYDRAGAPHIVSGTIDEIVAELTAAGYRITVDDAQ